MERLFRWLDRWLATPLLRWMGMPKPVPRPVSHLVIRVGPRGGPTFLCGRRRRPGDVAMIMPSQVTCPACLEQLPEIPQPAFPDPDESWQDLNREP